MPIPTSRLLAVALFGVVSTAALASTTSVVVFKRATCSCCEKWVEHLRTNGFEVQVLNVPAVSVERKRLGMPDRLASCHIGQVNGGYLVEGHVPAQDIRQLLAMHPKVLGVAVPSMAPGAPGMETTPSHPYETLLVQTDGRTSIFAKH